ncbi:MAG: ABC transporter permease [Candidatus Latescibacterota bacterium]|jgi:ABC-2 type transport system permease protein
MGRLRELVRKELLQLRRDRRLLPILFVAPVVQLALLGYAATTDLKDVPVAICDLDRSSASRALVQSFSAGGDFDLCCRAEAPADLNRFLDRGEAEIALVIPGGLARDLQTGRTVSLQLLVDGSKVNAAMALNRLSAALLGHAADLVSPGAVALSLPRVRVEPRAWYNPELSSRNFMVPGVLALLLVVLTTVVTSMAVVKEKETGTIEQLVVTPIRPWELIAGKLIPFALIGLVEVLLVLTVALFWFKVPLRGSLPLLLALSVLFVLNAQGIGLFVSTVSRTQQQAMMTSVFFVILPMMLLSGFAFPIENMPRPIQYLTYLLPLRYFLVILRGIFLKGVGLELLWPQVAALAGFGTAFLVLAAARFRKRIG